MLASSFLLMAVKMSPSLFIEASLFCGPNSASLTFKFAAFSSDCKRAIRVHVPEFYTDNAHANPSAKFVLSNSSLITASCLFHKVWSNLGCFLKLVLPLMGPMKFLSAYKYSIFHLFLFSLAKLIQAPQSSSLKEYNI